MVLNYIYTFPTYFKVSFHYAILVVSYFKVSFHYALLEMMLEL